LPFVLRNRLYLLYLLHCNVYFELSVDLTSGHTDLVAI